MPNDFQMEIKIKMNAVVSNGGNIIHVTEIKIRNCAAVHCHFKAIIIPFGNK
jgi:hypothetical protein